MFQNFFDATIGIGLGIVATIALMLALRGAYALFDRLLALIGAASVALKRWAKRDYQYIIEFDDYRRVAQIRRLEPRLVPHANLGKPDRAFWKKRA